MPRLHMPARSPKSETSMRPGLTWTAVLPVPGNDGHAPRTFRVAASEGITASEALALMADAAREAGEIGLRFAKHGAKTFTKSDLSPVTEADLAIDAHLASRLRDVSPEV